MNLYKNENSFKKNIHISSENTSKNISLFNLKLAHKIFDSINISLLILVFILSFISFNSQREWTTIYINLAKTRANNNNLIDCISQTEEFYINEIESLNTFKKTTPNDLMYVSKKITKQKKNNLNNRIKIIHNGLRDSKYQRGY